MVHDMREREYVTFLRNYREGFGASRYAHATRTPLQIEVNRRVNALNTGRIHVGNAAADAAMFLSRKPFNSDTAFRHLYSLASAEIHEISSLRHYYILRVMDSAGTVYYQGRHMEQGEQTLFDLIINLVREGRFAEANNTAKAAVDDGKSSNGFMHDEEED